MTPRRSSGASTATVLACLAVGLALTSCAGDSDPAAPVAGVGTDLAPATIGQGTPRPSASPSSAPPATFDARGAMRTVETLAGDIGPRESTSKAYREAASLVAAQFRDSGYEVREQGFQAPQGVSWGVPVRAGRTVNVIATPAGLAPTDPYIVIGAHLDTVPQAPGAEDNASGVAVMLELARLAATAPQQLRTPVVFVAFGAEEPRAPGDSGHHYGSRHYVEELTRPQQHALTAMVSLDRVGVASAIPVCTGGLGTRRVARDLLAVAERIELRAAPCENRASDHWSFEKAGFAVARLGSTPYPAYHSPRDLPPVVARAQLARVGTLMWAWLTEGRAG